MQGMIFSIEEFSVYDGPGIRTTVFLKGCPLRCTWCHNPEGQSACSEIVKSPNGCIGCGRCEANAVCENGVLRYTEASMAGCPRNLLRRMGEEMTPDALCQKLLRNREMLVGGGVTFSGGEPLYQGEFVLQSLERLKGKLHTALQTSGFCARELFDRALALSDYFLYDLKLIDDTAHKRYTGVTNAPILENFRVLCRSGKPFTVRVPLIPGVTDTKENISAIATLLQENGVDRVELLPYNKMAGGKYKLVGREYTPCFDEQKEPEPHLEIFAARSIKCTVL